VLELTLFNRDLRVFPNTFSLLVDNWPTPLVKLEGEALEGREAWAKLEFYNPFSRSIKDRAVWGMLLEALKRGDLGPRLEEASSGNLGIALSCLSNLMGLKATIYLPKPTPESTEVLLRLLGAEVVRTEHQTINKRFQEEVKRHASSSGAVNLNQFENDANFRIHYETTAEEIVKQLNAVGRRPDCLVAGIGTSGHIAAIAKRLKEEYGDEVRVVGVQPSQGSVIPGIKRVETGPKWLKMGWVDEVVEVSLEEAVRGVVEVARREGLLIGLSSGAVYSAYRRMAGKGVYVLVFPDDAFKYLGQLGRFVGKGIM